MNGKSASKVIKIIKKYPEFQLGPLDIEFKPGKITAIVGPNGAGKTTLLYLLLGIKKEDGGSVISPPLQKSSIVGLGFLPLTLTLNQVADMYKTRIESDTFKKHIKDFNLSFSKRINQMSSGQRLLSQWAVALSLKSEIFILDEPFNNIDIIFRDKLYEKLSKFVEKQSIPCIITSHNLLEIDLISDEIIFLNNGDIVEHFNKKERKLNYFLVNNKKETHRLSLLTTKKHKEIIGLKRGEECKEGKQMDLIEIFRLIFTDEKQDE